MTMTDHDKDPDLEDKDPDLEDYDALLDDDGETATPLVKKLRRDLKLANKRAKDRDDLAAENATLKLDQKIAKAGLADLTEKERKAVLAAHEGDDSPEALRVTASELFPSKIAPPEPDVPEDALDAQDRINAASTGAGTGTTSVPSIKPGDVSGWSNEKWARFQKEHPDEAESLKRGEEVRGITV